MSPIDYFNAVWVRCEELTALHSYLNANNTSALPLDEILRAEWVARVSALDLYIHELIAQKMMNIFNGSLPVTDSFSKFKISNETLSRIRNAASPVTAGSAFELEVRGVLERVTYQDPEVIADGIRLVSNIELWNELAIIIKGATPATKATEAKILKKDLSLIVSRRNKIAHEGDLQPSAPRAPWPITKLDLAFVAITIEQVVRAIDSKV